jgi:hypothetical protein
MVYAEPPTLHVPWLGEVRSIHLPGTQVNKGKSKGWAMGKPTSNSGKEKKLLRR